MQVGPTEYVPLADVRQGTVLELIPLEVFPLIEAFRTTRAGRFPQHCEFKRSFGKSGRDLGQFQSPWGLAIGKDGVLICAEHQNHRVQLMTPEGKPIKAFGSYGTTGDYNFNLPIGVAVDSNYNIIVSNYGGHRVQVYDSEAKFLFKFGREGRGDGELQYPYDVAVQLQTNRIIVADSLNQRVQCFDSKGNHLKTLKPSGVSDFQSPTGLKCDPHDNIFVSDQIKKHLLMFNPEGDFIRKINFGPKSAVERSSLDFHPVPHVLLASPYSFTIDSDGKIVLVDYSYHRIVVYHAIDKHAPKEMDAQVFLTCGGQQEKGTPLPPEAKLQNPIAIVMDQGIVYLSDYGNHRICVFGSVDK